MKKTKQSTLPNFYHLEWWIRMAGDWWLDPVTKGGRTREDWDTNTGGRSGGVTQRGIPLEELMTC